MVTSLFASVGSTLGGVGTARVTGEDSQWQNTKTFLVGNAGNGTLYIEDGGTVINGTDVRIGEEAGSTGRIEVTGNGTPHEGQGRRRIPGRRIREPTGCCRKP